MPPAPFTVLFKAVAGGVTTYTLQATLEVITNPAVTGTQNDPLVSISAADAAWVTLAATAVPDGGDVVDANDLGTAAYAATGDFDAAGAAATAQAASVPIAQTVETKTADYTITINDAAKILETSGVLSITLPGGLANSIHLTTVNIANGTVTFHSDTGIISSSGRSLVNAGDTAQIIYNQAKNEWRLFGDLAVAVSYVMRDEFTTTEAAPLASPRTMEPGPGTLTIVDTTPTYSIVGGELVVGTGNVSNYTDPQIYSDEYTNRPGLMAYFGLNAYYMAANQGYAGLASGITGVPASPSFWLYYHQMRANTSSQQGSDGRVIFLQSTTAVDGVQVELAVISRGTGVFFATRANGDMWRIVYMDTTTTAAKYRLRLHGLGRPVNYKEIGLLQLRGNWAVEGAYGMAIANHPTVTAGQVITGAANCWIQYTVTAVTGVTQELMVRYIDDDNCVIIRMSQADSTIKLIEKIGGTETERATAAQTWTNGSSYKLLVSLDTYTLNAFIGVTTKLFYSKLTTGVTETSIKVSYAGTLLTVWPLEVYLETPNINAGRKCFLVVGDSKVLGLSDDTSPYGNGQNGFPLYLRQSSGMIEVTPRSGYSGKTLADIVSTYLYPDMAQSYFNPDFVLLNIGANDVAAIPAQSTWEANLATCLDAWHTRYPKAHIYITRPWRQTYDAQCNLLAGYIDNVIATRSEFAHLGVDERIFLKGSDNGATYTSDGIHPNHLGHVLSANEWRKLLNV